MFKYKIIYCGTPDFACAPLQTLWEDDDFEVVQVITQPDRPVGRKQVITPPPVKELAESLGIPVSQPEDINQVDLPECDYLVVVSYGQLLSQAVLDHPKIAPVNIHPSLLPKYRGATPVPHAILAGDDVTGVTIQRMAKRMDAGPILAQVEYSLNGTETSGALLHTLFEVGADLLLEVLKQPLQEVKQDESVVTYCSKFTRESGEVDPSNMTAEEIDRHVRALVPWPGVKTVINGKEAKLIEASLTEHPDALEVVCAGGSILYIAKMQSPGKNVVSGKDWI